MKTNTSPQNLVFIHGNLGSARWWYPAIDACENLFTEEGRTKNHSILTADLRGCGSYANPTPGKISVEDLVHDFESICVASKMQNIFLVGHSAGGLIAALLATKRPDVVSRLMLIDPVAPTGLKNVPADIGEKYKAMLQDRALASQILSLTIYQNDPSRRFFKEDIMDDTMFALKETGDAMVKCMQNINYNDHVAKIKVPVTLFYGAHDWVVDQPSCLEYKALLPQTEFILLPENGHCFNFENPARLASEISQRILHT